MPHVAIYAALKELGLSPYHFLEVLRNKNNKHLQLWGKAVQAKYGGLGAPFEGEDFDQMLWDYDVSVYVSSSPKYLYVYHHGIPNLLSHQVTTDSHAVPTSESLNTCIPASPFRKRSAELLNYLSTSIQFLTST